MIQNWILEIQELIEFTKLIIHSYKNRTIMIRSLVIEQLVHITFRSLGTVLFSGFFVGAILVIQFNMILSKYEATVLLGGLTVSAIIREIGPLFISFLLAGKVGAYTASELGTMKVTEQIDAIRCMGVDPIEYLILPRLLSIILSSLILLFFGLLIGIIGSMFLADTMYHLNTTQFIQSIPRFSNYATLFNGMIKSFIFGTIIAIISTCKGMNTKNGAQGVGVAVTKTAIYINLTITIMNSVSSWIFNQISEFIHLVSS